MEEKELNMDTLNLLRAVMKISSSLNDLDEVIEQKTYYKYGFKIEARRWVAFMEQHTADLMKSLVEEDSNLLMEVYNAIDEAGSKVQMNTPEHTSLLLFYVKLKSALHDIETMGDTRNTFYPKFIEVFTKKVTSQIENQYNFIQNTIDSEGNGVDIIIDFYNKLGSKIMHIENDLQD